MEENQNNLTENQNEMPQPQKMEKANRNLMVLLLVGVLLLIGGMIVAKSGGFNSGLGILGLLIVIAGIVILAVRLVTASKNRKHTKQ